MGWPEAAKGAVPPNTTPQDVHFNKQNGPPLFATQTYFVQFHLANLARLPVQALSCVTAPAQ